MEQQSLNASHYPFYILSSGLPLTWKHSSHPHNKAACYINVENELTAAVLFESIVLVDYFMAIFIDLISLV